MPTLGRLHIGLLLLAIANMLPAIAAEDAWGLLAIAVAAAASSGAYARRTGGARFPRWILHLAIALASCHLLYEMFYPQAETTVHIVDLAHFIILLCCCKFFELHTYRDAGLVALISFLLMIISALVSASLVFGAIVALDITVGLAWLIAYHTHRQAAAVDDRRQAALVATIGQTAGDAARSARTVRPAHLRTTLMCSLTIALVGAIVFLCTPRGWSFGVFGRMRGGSPVRVTGLSDVVELTSDAVLEDPSPVMRVRYTRGGRPLTDTSLMPYMRALTFGRYYQGQWRRTPTAYPQHITKTSAERPAALTNDITLTDLDGMIRQEVWLDAPTAGVLCAIYPPRAFSSSEVQVAELDRRDLVLKALDTTSETPHYVVYSTPEQRQPRRSDARKPPRFWRDGRSSIPPRLRELARELAAAAGNPADPTEHRQVATAFRNYLASDRYAYALDRGTARANGDPIEDFLFENRRGHCEYFASAMTLLCQAVGIRARLASGYCGGERNDVGEFYQFRQQDAHAWVEVYLIDEGWTIFDPTPADAIAPRTADVSWLAEPGRFMDYARFKWSTLIVGFDANDRSGAARSFRAWFANLTGNNDEPKSLGETVESLLWGPDLLRMWQRAFYWLLLVLCAAFVLLTLRVLWIVSWMLGESLPGRTAKRAGPQRRSDAKFYDRLLLLLAHKGHVKSAQSTPREFALALARSQDDFIQLPQMTDWFYEVQYGGRSLSRSQWSQIKGLLQRLREDPSFGVA